MPRRSDTLAGLLARFHARQSEEWREAFESVIHKRGRHVETLAAHGVVTVGHLLERLRGLPRRLAIAGVELISLLRIGQAAPQLFEMMESKPLRMSCAVAIATLPQVKGITERLLEIGWRELGSSHPDPHWLRAVVEAIGHSDDRRAADLLIRVYERGDLPASLRGEAADRLGCHSVIGDRRTTIHRRSRTAAIQGLTEGSIDLQFWSMYLIGQLACSQTLRSGRSRSDFDEIIPALQSFAADHRLAPGYWWPMSAEAEDVLHCLEHGGWPEMDAAERWQSRGERGPMNPEQEPKGRN